jgi:hypothetical protein
MPNRKMSSTAMIKTVLARRFLLVMRNSDLVGT